MHRSLFIALVLLVAAACVRADGRSRFTLATFSADVTPPLGHTLEGTFSIKPALKVTDPLLAHGMDAMRPTGLAYRYGIVTNRALPDLSLITLQGDTVEVVVRLRGWELGVLRPVTARAVHLAVPHAEAVEIEPL